MGCLSLRVTPTEQASLSVEATASAKLSVLPTEGASVAIVPGEQASLSVTPTEQASLSVTPTEQARLTIGLVCSISAGAIVVLAASDGPLRTKNGGYILLDPEANPPEG